MKHAFDYRPAASPEFVQLLTSHQADLWAYILALLPGHPDVKEILQKTNLVLWKNHESFVPGTNFRAWAMAVARFEVKAHLKSMSRRPCFVFDEEVLDRLAEDAVEVMPQATARLNALEQCLGGLRPEDRELIDYRYRRVGGLDEYAARSRRSVSALSVTLYRLRAILRRCIAGKLDAAGGAA